MFPRPIRFENEAQVTSFISELAALNLISIVTNRSGSQKIFPRSSFDTNFVMTTEGDFYLVPRIREFIEKANDAEIAKVNLTFLLPKEYNQLLGFVNGSNFTHNSVNNMEKFSLSQLKAHPNILDYPISLFSWEKLISALNLNLYLPISEFNSLIENVSILEAKKILDMKVLSKMHQESNGVQFLKLIYRGRITSVLEFRLFEIIKNVNKDILVINIRRLALLKLSLLNKHVKLKDLNEITACLSWLSDIDKEIFILKDTLQKVLDLAMRNKVFSNIEDRSFREAEKIDPGFKRSQLNIDNAKITIAQKEVSLKRVSSIFKILKLVVKASISLLPILIIALSIVLAAIFAPASLTILISATCAFVAAGIMLEIRHKSIRNIGRRIFNWVDANFDLHLAARQSEIISLKEKCLELEKKHNTHKNYQQSRGSIQASVRAKEAFIAEVEANLLVDKDIQEQCDKLLMTKSPILSNSDDNLTSRYKM